MLSRRIRKGEAVCPKADHFIEQRRRQRWLRWAFPIWGFLALIWFLIRVIPKPSRAAYPCQRVAAPFASGFLVWIAGLVGSSVAYRNARRLVRESRYALAAICAAAAVVPIWWALSVTAEKPADAAFSPADLPNSPIGEGKGIYPGRVVWAHEPAATSWDGTHGSWWDDNNTDQRVVNGMVSRAIRSLTGQSSDADAWDALFRHFNQTKGFGDVGYKYGEPIAIKLNMNQDSGGSWGRAAGMPSPHVIYALVDQLINAVGVPGSAITLYDASRYIGNPIYDKVRSNPDADFQAVRFVVKPSEARSGRIVATRDTSNTVYFGSKSVPNTGTTNLPRCVTQAKYLINMALLRPHSLFGITLCAKNHFGSVYSPSGGDWTPSPLHDFGSRSNPMASYNCLVDLVGHEHLGGKTLLYVIDGLYPARNQGANVIKFRSFGNDWCSSVFLSQDPVAIDSVALDFLRNEPNCTDVTGNPDNYLHEAALANNPPSGTFYDPEGDGTRLGSLGVHEHWNNAVDKQYSRNLGTGEGIELIAAADEDPPYVDGCVPAPGAVDVDIGTSIVLHVKDDGAGVDKTSIVMTVNGIEVTPGIKGTPTDHRATYNPPSDFGYGQTVTVTVDAADLRSPPNNMARVTYSFTTMADDATPPVITLSGGILMTLECGTPYAEPGYTATDDRDGHVTANVVVTGSVDPTIIGTYTLHYNVSDSSGNPAGEKIRTVEVVDTTAPAITLLGEPMITLECGTSYEEPGYTATDACEGDLAAEVVVTGSVDHTFPGSYALKYNVKDSSGNSAQERARVVEVVDTTPPVITLLGDNPMTLEVGTPYEEPGYTVIDICDGDVAAEVEITGSVNHNVVGDYLLHYNVSDWSGNRAEEKVRTVNVVEAGPFEILGIAVSGPDILQLRWSSRSGHIYTIWSRSDLCGGQWNEEITISSQGESTTWTDAGTTFPCKFYRVELK